MISACVDKQLLISLAPNLPIRKHITWDNILNKLGLSTYLRKDKCL